MLSSSKPVENPKEADNYVVTTYGISDSNPPTHVSDDEENEIQMDDLEGLSAFGRKPEPSYMGPNSFKLNREEARSFLFDEAEDSASAQFMQETMHVDFFSGTFYAMRTPMKKKYKLLTADSADYY